MVFYGGQFDPGGYGGGGQYANAVLGSFDYTPSMVEPVQTAAPQQMQTQQAITPFQPKSNAAKEWTGVALQAADVGVDAYKAGAFDSSTYEGLFGGGGEAAEAPPIPGQAAAYASPPSDPGGAGGGAMPSAAGTGGTAGASGGSSDSGALSAFNRDILGQRSQSAQNAAGDAQAQAGIAKMSSGIQGQTVSGLSAQQAGSIAKSNETDIAGGATGAISGAASGAKVGAAIGTVVPGVGNVVGGIVGGIVGGAAGWFAGS